MEITISNPKEIALIDQYRRESNDSEASVRREVTALDSQKQKAHEANQMSVAELSKNPGHQLALMAEITRVLKQTDNS